MKKIGLATALSVLVFGFGFLAFADEVVISGMKGQVFVQHGEEMKEAKLNTACQTKDKIHVMEDGYVDLNIQGKVGCRLLANTKAQLKETDPNLMRVMLEMGNVLLNVKPLQGSTFELETPVAVSAVRGTKFWGQIVPSQKQDNNYMTLAVLEGTVDVTVKATKQTFSVKEGQAIDISSEEPARTQVRKAKTDELQALETSKLIQM